MSLLSRYASRTVATIARTQCVTAASSSSSASVSSFRAMKPAHSMFVRSFAVKVGETRYTKEHEWVTLTKADEVTLGITDYAQSALGDVVFIDLPEPATKFEAGEAFGSVESVKAASSVYAPVSIIVNAVNQPLKDDNSLINRDAEKDGWMIKAKLTKPDQMDKLMNKAAYEQLLKDTKH